MFSDADMDSVFQVTPSCSIRVKAENAHLLSGHCPAAGDLRLQNNIHFKNNMLGGGRGDRDGEYM